MINEKMLALIRAAIAAKDYPKKKLARACKVSRPDFAKFIHGDLEMPPEVRDKIFEVLQLDRGTMDLVLLSMSAALPFQSFLGMLGESKNEKSQNP